MANMKSIFQVKDKEKIKIIDRDFDQANDFLAQFDSKWKTYWDNYLGIRGARAQETTGQALSSLFIPKTGEKIDWLTAKYKQAMYNYRPIVNIVSRLLENKFGAEILNEMVDYQLFHVPNMRRKINDFLKDAFIRGSGVVKCFWDKDLYQPSFDSIPRRDCYIDPYARYIEEARYVIHRFYRSKEELWYSGLYDEEMIQALIDAGTPIKVEESGRTEQLDSESEELTPSQEGRYEIWEYWTKEGLITVANYVGKDKKGKSVEGKLIIREKEDIFKIGRIPFIAFIYNPKPNEFNGLGVAERMEQLQEEINATRRQIRDFISLTIAPQGIVARGAFSRWEREKMMENVPGEIFESDFVNVGDAYRPMLRPNMPTTALQEMAIITQDIDQATGIFEHAQGQQFSRRETATTTVSLLQRADLLFGSCFEDFAEQFLKPLAKTFVELDQQFYKRKIKSSKISLAIKKEIESAEQPPMGMGAPMGMPGMGMPPAEQPTMFQGTMEGGILMPPPPQPKPAPDKTIEIDPEEIKGEFDYELNVSAIRGSNEMERQQLLSVLELIAKVPQLSATFDLTKLGKQLLSTFDMIKNAEDLVNDQPQMPMMPGMEGTTAGLSRGKGVPPPSMLSIASGRSPMAGK